MLIGKLSDGSVIFGLSRLNIERLMEGKPIRITKESHPDAPIDGLPRIFITFGETEKDIADDLRAAEKGLN